MNLVRQYNSSKEGVHMLKKYVILCLLSFSLCAAVEIGFVFDVDGTLKSEDEWFKANEQMLINRGIEINEEVRGKLSTMPAGCGLAGSITFLRERFEGQGFVGLDNELQAEKERIALDILEETGSASYYPGAEDFLKQVQKRKIRMAVATNAPTKALPVYAKAFNFEKYFGLHVYNPDHVGGKPKPNPALYLYAVEQIGLNPKQCIAFEDSPSGAKAAKEAGLFVVGYDSSDNKALSEHADMIVKEWQALNIDELIEKVSDQ